MWTVEAVKKELPNVKVKLGDGKIVEGVVMGKLHKYATVKVYIHQTWLSIGDTSWETIVHCLNNDRPIIC